MHTQKFKPRSFAETLVLLCHARPDEFMRAGKINQSEVARKAGTVQPNINRWLAGDFHPHDENIRKLAKAFKVSPAQMRGEFPIESLDGISPKTDLDREFFEDYQKVPDWVQESVRDQVARYLANMTDDEGSSSDR